MKNRTLILVLFGSGAALGALPMLLFFVVGYGPYTVFLLPGVFLTIAVTGDAHSETGLCWVTVFNAVVYGTVVAGIGWIRMRPKAIVGGKCARCTYDLTGNVSGVCPECGLRVAQDQTKSGVATDTRD